MPKNLSVSIFLRKNWQLLTFYFLLLTAYTCFSFGLTAPNLTLINQSWFVSFQQQMWQLFFNNRSLATTVFILLISVLFGTYLLLIKNVAKFNQQQNTCFSWQTYLILLLMLALPLLFSYNALSYDVFNYIFNAKMVVEYQADPHVQTAIEFSGDPWTRFMHNIHTPAPYGYGWTGLSLLPFLSGFGKFLTTWLSFRLWSILSLILTVLLIAYLKKQVSKKPFNLNDLILTFFNPLVLIEIVSNSHNDLWMMVFALSSLAMLFKTKFIKKSFVNRLLIIVSSIILLAFSISIKLASLALIPIWILLFLEHVCLLKLQINHLLKKIGLEATKEWLYNHWPFIASCLMFLPLLTTRSQQFHPWYLTWSLVWLPLITIEWWRQLLIAFSFTSLLRYIPWIKENQYNSQIIMRQKIITWSAPLWTMLALVMKRLLKLAKTDK